VTVVTLFGINEIYYVGGMVRGKEMGVYLSRKVVIFIADLETDNQWQKRERWKFWRLLSWKVAVWKSWFI